MSRATRIEFAGACYHVMSRGVARTATFLDDEDRRSFLEIVGGQVEMGTLQVFAFCVMPNHYHLLVSTPLGHLARWLRHVNGDHARRFNARHRRVGHLWQGRYKAILVEEGDYLHQCSRYIHLNPSRAKLARSAAHYRWSSYRNYLGGSAVVPWVNTGVVLDGFGASPQRYRAYVESGRAKKEATPFSRAHAGLALGGEAFVARVRAMVHERPDDADEPCMSALRRLGRPDPDRVEEAVERIFSAARPARQRLLKMHALRLHSGLRPAEIAQRFNRGRSTVTMATQRLAAEAAVNAELAAGLKTLSMVLAENNEL